MGEDESFFVRGAALEALFYVAEKDDERAIEQSYDLLEHKDPDVRRAAIDALLRIAPRGNHRAVTGVGMLVDDQDTRVADRAREALELLRLKNAENDDDNADQNSPQADRNSPQGVDAGKFKSNESSGSTKRMAFLSNDR